MTDPDRYCDSVEEPPAPAEAHSREISESGPAIAIVGMACRFPGADSIAAFWRLLEAGENAVQEGIPGSGIGRVGALFPDDTGQINACRFGAYLDNLDQFDAAFFSAFRRLKRSCWIRSSGCCWRRVWRALEGRRHRSRVAERQPYRRPMRGSATTTTGG